MFAYRMDHLRFHEYTLSPSNASAMLQSYSCRFTFVLSIHTSLHVPDTGFLPICAPFPPDICIGGGLTGAYV